MTKKKKIIIISSIVATIILALMMTTYIQTLSYNPNHSFIFTSSGNFYKSEYYVSNHKIYKRKLLIPKGYPLEGQENIYLYNIKKNKIIKLSYNQAKLYQLDNSPVSPNGYKIISAQKAFQRVPSILMLSHNAMSLKYITKDAYHKKIVVPKVKVNYYSFRFIGWVIPKTNKSNGS